MSNNENTYILTLPKSVNSDIRDWFEKMDRADNLSNELIYLVNCHLKSLAGQAIVDDKPDTEMQDVLQHNLSINESDFFDSLYNWQEASTSIFIEPELEDQRVKKKKMLTV